MLGYVEKVVSFDVRPQIRFPHMRHALLGDALPAALPLADASAAHDAWLGVSALASLAAAAVPTDLRCARAPRATWGPCLSGLIPTLPDTTGL